MKKYQKPLIEIETFMPNVAVATSCHSTIEGTTTTYPAQTVNCVIEGQETIFQSGTSGCKSVVSLSTTGSYDFITYNNQLYFCWKGSPTSNPDSEKTDLLDKIMQQGGYESGRGWHAGPATTVLQNLYTASY